MTLDERGQTYCCENANGHGDRRHRNSQEYGKVPGREVDLIEWRDEEVIGEKGRRDGSGQRGDRTAEVGRTDSYAAQDADAHGVREIRLPR